MIALCWKELRENARWALLLMAGLAFAEWYALRPSEENLMSGYYFDLKGLGLCRTAFLTVTTFGCGLTGLLLGLLQILPELRRDQWASLLHRPVSRGTVFRGKVLGGLILYALATVPPFLFSVWLVATPGHYAFPFVPETVFPGTADICAGTAFYFAALAMALQRGGWIGARVLPLLAALHASYFVLANDWFYVAVEAAVLMSLALFTAGWGIMLHQEKFGARPWLAKAAFLAMMFYGACGLGDLAGSILGVIGPSTRSQYIQYVISDAGVPLRSTYENDVVTSVTDLDGKPVADKKFQPNQIRNHTKYLNGFSSYIGDSHGWHESRYRRPYRNIYHYLSYNRAYGYPRLEQWFDLLDQKSWIGYLPNRQQAMGRLDREGFKPMSATPVPFGEDDRTSETGDSLILYDKTRVRLASLPKREIVDVALPGPGPIYGVGTAYARVGNSSVSVFGVTLAGQLAVYDEKGVLITALPYHQDVSRWGQLSLGLNGAKDRFYLKYDPSAWIPWRTRSTMPAYFEEMDAKGQVLQTYTMPPLPPSHWPQPWSRYLASRIGSPAFFFGLMGYQKIGAMFGSKRLENDLAGHFRQDWERTKQLLYIIPILSLLLASATLFWAIQAHFSRRRAWAWTVFVLAFGPAGFVAFRVSADWPQFVPCPHCRKPRSVAGEICPHCGSGWPATPVEGTEIFDHQPSPVMAGAQL